MQTPEAFIVGYSPVRAAGRVARAESLMRRAVLSVAIYLGISAIVWWTTRNQISFTQFLWGGVIGAVLVLGFIIWRWVELRSARRSLGRVPAGEAVRIDHRGLHLDGDAEPGSHDGRVPTTFDWSGLKDIRAAGTKVGAGPNMVIEHQEGAWEVPLSYLDTLPGTIDSAIRAYSGGRRGLDLSGLDSIWGE